MRLNELNVGGRISGANRMQAGVVSMACGLAVGIAVVGGGCAIGGRGTELSDGRYVEKLRNVEDVVCYYASKSAASEALPSMALQSPRAIRGPSLFWTRTACATLPTIPVQGATCLKAGTAPPCSPSWCSSWP